MVQIRATLLAVTIVSTGALGFDRPVSGSEAPSGSRPGTVTSAAAPRGPTGQGSQSSTAGDVAAQRGLPEDLRQIRRDRASIQQDRASIHAEENLDRTDQQDLRAAEHDLKIHPQNTAADQARIASDQKAIHAARQEIQASRQDLHQSQRNEESVRNSRNPGRQNQAQTAAASPTGTTATVNSAAMLPVINPGAAGSGATMPDHGGSTAVHHKNPAAAISAGNGFFGPGGAAQSSPGSFGQHQAHHVRIHPGALGNSVGNAQTGVTGTGPTIHAGSQGIHGGRTSGHRR
jgi:hypothetical protein